MYIETLGLISINTTVTVNVSATCVSDYYLVNGKCLSSEELICINNFESNLPFIYYYYENYYDYYYSYENPPVNCTFCYDECCYDDSTDQCLSICTSGTGVPINNLTCIDCTHYSKYGIILFIGLELIPMTLMVIVIIIFNIQLTNGSINAVVLYSQLIAIIQSINGLNSSTNIFCDADFTLTIFQHLSAIPCYMFNLDFTPFLFNYIPLCISDHMSPLGAISFWYVIGFYPLLLLLLLYIWMTLYDKGFKCVAFITRPFHRCMARFWSMTGIEPSFTHSIASIYILCFTQLTATSFKILSFTPSIRNDINNTRFYYDTRNTYFVEFSFLGLLAILVLLFLIILPTLCILFYPFKWFQKLLDCLHLRKPLLITLADVFTGPYKNGTENTFDYRFMAGLYLLARIIILSQLSFGYQDFYVLAVPLVLFCCHFLLAAVVSIFRPFYRNMHNFTEFLILSLIAVLGCITIPVYLLFIYIVLGFDILIFGIIIPIYTIYHFQKIIKACHYYHKKRVPVIPTEQDYEEDAISLEDNWVADRMENPQDYDEHHIPLKPYDPLPMNKQSSVAGAVKELKRPLLDT